MLIQLNVIYVVPIHNGHPQATLYYKVKTLKCQRESPTTKLSYEQGLGDCGKKECPAKAQRGEDRTQTVGEQTKVCDVQYWHVNMSGLKRGVEKNPHRINATMGMFQAHLILL